jgi:hypothetical protein
MSEPEHNPLDEYLNPVPAEISAALDRLGD